MPTSKSTTARSGVFISYARSDGEEFANLLCRRLESEDEHISFWMDRSGMEGGNDWWLQIAKKLDQVEFMALVMTPDAQKSATVRKEWRYARQQGVCIYPVKGTSDLDFHSLPRWMRDAHFYDLGTLQNDLKGPEWKKFVNDLNTRCQTRRVPFMVENLPEGFIPRPDEFNQLFKLLGNERREEPVAITAALKGAGGYGKTTLARALCHDKQIQDVFDDGILWVTLGQQPGDLTGRVEDLIVTLGGERPGFTTLDAAVNRFKELLADRDILIVIDDVWDRSHLYPFTQGGPRCACLITTRNLDTLPVNAEKVPVDAMRPGEARALLAGTLDQPSLQDGGLNPELAQLASSLGEWPLLLRLVNSTLRNCIENEGQSPRDAITWVNEALDRRGLAFFDARNSNERHQAVATTIGVSLDSLTKQERERYSELAIFPEDVEIPLATLEKLWGKTAQFDEFDTKELCSRLNRFSLLSSYDANQRRIRLHDVVRKFLIVQQGDKLRSTHVQLLDALCETSPPLWSEMPAEEPYLWEHLAHHLVAAGRYDELVATVKNWRYLVAKILIRNWFAIERDLQAAEELAGNDESLRLLRRNFVNSGHLLSRCGQSDELKLTLFSRLCHLNDLAPLTTDLSQHLKRPYLVPINKLPDLSHPALVRTLSGHADAVLGCAVSADGATIVSTSADQTLKVWDGQSGAERFTLTGHAGRVLGCALSMDGATIVSACEDGTLKVWDGQSGVERFTLSGHAGAVNGCAVTANGATIVSASDDRTVKVWDGQSGAERLTLKGHVGFVFDCAVSADGATIVSGSEDHTLRVWDGHSGAERFTLSSHAGGVRGCAVSADGMAIVSASDDQTLKIWDGRTGEERLTLCGHEDWVRRCAISADGPAGPLIVSASSDQTLKVWELRSGAERLTLSGHLGVVFGCAVSANGAVIVSASHDGTLKVWDGSSEPANKTARFMLSGVVGCAMSADGGTIVSISQDHTLKVWNGRSNLGGIGTERFTLSGHTDSVLACAVSEDGATIISVSEDGTLRVWDGYSGVERFMLSGHPTCCAVSADGATIVSAFSDRTLKVWDGRSGAERLTWYGHKDLVFDCAVSVDGMTIVSASDDETLKVWDGQTGAERFTLRGHTDWVRGCAVSADGTTIVSACFDQTLKVWDARSGAERLTLSGHADWVNGCAMSADGTMIVSASEDQTLKLWNAGTGECLSSLRVDGPLTCCACSSDGELIVAGGDYGIYFLRLVH